MKVFLEHYCFPKLYIIISINTFVDKVKNVRHNVQLVIKDWKLNIQIVITWSCDQYHMVVTRHKVSTVLVVRCHWISFESSKTVELSILVNSTWKISNILKILERFESRDHISRWFLVVSKKKHVLEHTHLVSISHLAYNILACSEKGFPLP